MADDDVSEDDFEEDELDATIDADDLEEELEEDLESLDATAVGGDDEVFEENEEEEEAVAAVAAPPATDRARRKAKEDEEEVEEEEYDADDVEADLDTILKDRIAAADDEDEDEEEEVTDKRSGETAEGVAPKKANEFTCMQCFLLVNPAQFGRPDNPRCPVGEEDCPSIAVVKKLAKKR
ncbi:MAG: hypothetical protein HYX32_01665 [Actinobacteria bacterium]|nr:hypothetical protein [Actinomycetota bacterium]